MLGWGRQAGYDSAGRIAQGGDGAAATGAPVRKGAVSRAEYNMLGDAILGGLSGFALQTRYIPYELADVYMHEGWWRVAARRLFGDDPSSPSFTYYLRAEQSTDGKRGREHIWSVGLAALNTCM